MALMTCHPKTVKMSNSFLAVATIYALHTVKLQETNQFLMEWPY